jgi:predicted metal-binding protein
MGTKMKSYPAHWQGQLLLACRKCQKKLKHNDDLKALANLKETVKKHKKTCAHKMHILNVPCMDLCPKDAVSVCIPAISDERLFILRSESDLNKLALSSG